MTLVQVSRLLADGHIQATDGRADVAVIGGGFTGLSAALALAKRGASVAVLDAGRIGGGASGRNGGQVNTGVAQDFAAPSLTAETARPIAGRQSSVSTITSGRSARSWSARRRAGWVSWC